MYCMNCGKQIPNGAVYCPECGTSQRDSAPQSSGNTADHTYEKRQSAVNKVPYNTLCILGLVISGTSLLLNFLGLVGLVGLGGIIVSIMGLKSCKKKNENGKVLAIIGIVIGAISVLDCAVLVLRTLDM